MSVLKEFETDFKMVMLLLLCEMTLLFTTVCGNITTEKEESIQCLCE